MIYSENRARVLRGEPEEPKGVLRFGWQWVLKDDLQKGDLIIGTTSGSNGQSARVIHIFLVLGVDRAGRPNWDYAHDFEFAAHPSMQTVAKSAGVPPRWSALAGEWAERLLIATFAFGQRTAT